MADTSQPDTLSVLQSKAIAKVILCRDVYAGTDRLRERGDVYLPRFPLENGPSYENRLKTSVLYNALRRTVAGLVGLVLRNDVQVSEDVPPDIADHLEDVDQEGTHLDVFAFDLLRDSLLDGHVHVLVDMDTVDPNVVRTKKDEISAGLRPYWVRIEKGQVLRWSAARIGGQKILTSLAYKELVYEKAGAYGDKEVEQVRTFALMDGGPPNKPSMKRHVAWETFQRRENAKNEKVWVSVGAGTMTVDEIPFVTVYANRTAFMVSDPPLEDLAHENLVHYRTRSDRQNSLHIAGIPIPFSKGLPEGEVLKVSSGTAINLPENGDLEYLEPKGSSLDASRGELDDIERRMASLGLSLLQRSQARSPETAEAKRIDKSEQDSTLAKAARSLEDGLENCLRLHAKWMGLDTEVGEIGVNDNFADLTLDPQTILAFISMVDKDQLSIETLWSLLEAGGSLPDDFDADAEKARIEKQANRMVPAALKAFAGRVAAGQQPQQPAIVPPARPVVPPTVPPPTGGT